MKIKLPPALTQQFARFKLIAKHHFFFFGVVMLGGLVWAVYTVNETLGMPPDENYRQEQIAKALKSEFDKTTISKIEALKKSSEQAANPTPLPAGVRTNPFAE